MLSTLVIACDILLGNEQHMWIMNLLWPITAMWSGPVDLWAYHLPRREGTHVAPT